MEKFGVCHTTLWNWARTGVLIPVKVGRKIHYRLSDVKNFWSVVASFSSRKEKADIHIGRVSSFVVLCFWRDLRVLPPDFIKKLLNNSNRFIHPDSARFEGVNQG